MPSINVWFESHPHLRQFIINFAACLLGGYLAIIWAGPQIPPQAEFKFTPTKNGSEAVIANRGIMNLSGSFKVVSEDSTAPIRDIKIKSGGIFSSIGGSRTSMEKYVTVKNLPKNHDIVVSIEGPKNVSLQAVVGGDTFYVPSSHSD